ncbi:MAG: ABC transporter permease [Candidatus Latescibacteria bacterium]|nr:ABC transporter permease [Candidatus Latescibacterota bacterium]
MNIWDSIVIGLTQLKANKLRSLLSLIGILIAVGSVTGIVSIGDGLHAYITREFEEMGGFNTIWSWAPNNWYRNANGQWVRRKWEEYLTYRDIEAIEAETDMLDFVMPNINVGGGNWDIRYRSASLDAMNVTCTGPAYPQMENWRVASGRFFNALDLINKAKVIVLGHEVAANLFGEDVDPVEKEVKVGGTRYTVVGVMEDKKFFDNNYGMRSMIPITTAQARITGNDRLQWIVVRVKRSQDVPAVAEAMKRVYKRLHEHGEEFNIRTGEQAIEEINRVLLIMKAVAGGIAGISLIVGGIGIMNIMLVSVTERTREIGIRKALGAKRGAILFQFLVEAVVLCLFGGMLGVMLGLGLGSLIAIYITSLTKMTFISVVSPKMMLLAVSFSVFVGVTFGVYPAWRASRLDPVDALRHE